MKRYNAATPQLREDATATRTEPVFKDEKSHTNHKDDRANVVKASARQGCPSLSLLLAFSLRL